jgi:translation initiation factor IF-1
MVKNDAGGNKGKGLARKHVNAAKCGGSKLLRVATDEAERYAVVSKMLGNGMCYVRLLSGGNGGSADKLCIIRNKFKGRGKRDNILDSGSWVLVGMREWASKQDTCDLLEVYNDGERDRLMKNEPCFKGVVANESGGTNNGTNNGTNSSGGSLVQFADSTTLKYSKLIKDENEDEDDEDDLQQRVYDMPSSDSDSDDDDESDESLEAVISVKPVAAPKLKTDHINVDDI